MVCAVGAKIGANHFSYWTEAERLHSDRSCQFTLTDPSLIVSPPGNEVGIDFCVPVCKLNRILRTEPIRAPALKAHPLPSNPVSDEVALVRVQIVIKIVPINILSEPASISWRICIYGLGSKIQLWQMWKSRHIDSRSNGESLPDINWGLAIVEISGIVFRQQSVRVKLQPIAHMRGRIREISADRPLSGIATRVDTGRTT